MSPDAARIDGLSRVRCLALRPRPARCGFGPAQPRRSASTLGASWRLAEPARRPLAGRSGPRRNSPTWPAETAGTAQTSKSAGKMHNGRDHDFAAQTCGNLGKTPPRGQPAVVSDLLL